MIAAEAAAVLAFVALPLAVLAALLLALLLLLLLPQAARATAMARQAVNARTVLLAS